MPVRRAADPLSVQHVWDAIRFANLQHQMADMSRITKYLQKVDNCTQTQAELYIKQTANDGLIIALNKVHSKGARTGEQVESFKIPSQEMPTSERDGKDWYCIDCHLAGDVISCQTCHRVFHPECGYKQMQNYKTFSTDFGTSNINLEAENDNVDNYGNTNSQTVVKDPPVPTEPTENISLQENDTINTSPALNNTPKEIKVDKDELESDTTDTTDTDDDNTEQSKEENISDVPKAELIEADKENDILSLKINETILNYKDANEYDAKLCSICNIYRMEPDLPLEKEELNCLLTFVHNRIKSWLPSRITDKVFSAELKADWLTEEEEDWRSQQLFYENINMSVMETKLHMKEYTRASAFKADVMTVRHNIGIYHGTESQEFGAAEYMRKDCEYDIAELINCVDCYRHSNEKINDKWFCLPCRVPHTLVWAKQKGYPHWPAKVIKIVDGNYDVRFFGAKYERSVLPSSQIRAITDPPKEVAQNKKASALVKAIEELTLHQKMLANPDQIEQLIDKKKKAPSKSLTRNSLEQRMQKSKMRERSKSSDLSSKDIYDFTDSPSNGDNSNGYEKKTTKRKISKSPNLKAKSKKLSEFQRRSSISNQNRNKSGSDFKNGVSGLKPNFSTDGANSADFYGQSSFDFRDEDYEFGKGYDTSNAEVSSSTERISNEGNVRENYDGLMPQTERQYCEAVEKLRRRLEQCPNKSDLIVIAVDEMQAEIDKIKTEHAEYTKRLFELHNAQISETKKKQWCYNCEQDAIYHCCWNTAYCSPSCQQSHWHAEHKKVCRRKR